MKFYFPKLAKYAWLVLAYNILVILYGAFVRASGSGAGCGAHWPLCNGVVIPREPMLETSIEFIHRLTSGLTIPLVVLLLIWCWKVFARNSYGRLWSVLSVVFTATEALIGAGLVLFGLVAENDSITRAFAMMAHLINTFLLLGSITLTAWWLSFGEPRSDRRIKWHTLMVVLGVMGMMVLGASGAITALGDTLFPSTSLVEGIAQDFSSTTHIFLRLRILHPVIAITISIYLVWASFKMAAGKPGQPSLRLAIVQSALCLFQLGVGAVNVLLLAPIWLQLVHLLITCLIWINFVLVSVTGRVTFHLPSRVLNHEIHHGIN